MNRRLLRGVVGSFAVLSVSVCVLTGCAQNVPIPTRSQLAGDWHHVGESAKLVLEPNGRFVLTDMPKGAVMGVTASAGAPLAGPPIDGYGLWKIGNDSGETRDPSTGLPIIELKFTDAAAPIDGIVFELAGTGSAQRLEQTISDPDPVATYDFVK